MAVSSRNKGFTFLEILVALAIMGSAFTVLLAAHASASRQAASANRLMVATLLARQTLTETEVDGPSDLGGDSGDFGEEFAAYTWEREVSPISLPLDTGFAFTTEDIREVTIRVSWMERGETRSTEIVYYASAGEP